MNYQNLNEIIIKKLIKTVGGANLENPTPLHEPNFKGTKSLDYLKECIDTGWVSSGGKWVNKFEEEICKYTKAKYAIAISNGTDALRLSLYIAGVRNGDEVL